MKISVIIPAYKTQQYLSQCVDSLFAQTYTDIEVILVDDGSPDSSPLLCDEYAQKDARIQVIHKVNGGAADSRNVDECRKAIQHAIKADTDALSRHNQEVIKQYASDQILKQMREIYETI